MLKEVEVEMQSESGIEMIEEVEDEDFELPAAAKNWLMSGKIMTVINDEFKKKKLHFFLTRDMKTFVCKEPKKAKVLQDYAVRVKKIYELIGPGYEDVSTNPYIKATGFFERKPVKNLCFSIVGPVTRHGRKNLYFICDTALEATKWIEYIEMIRVKVAMETKMA